MFWLVAAALAVVPAAIGLSGNASFSEEVPVAIPRGAELMDRSGHLLPARSPVLVARPKHVPDGNPRGDRGERDAGSAGDGQLEGERRNDSGHHRQSGRDNSGHHRQSDRVDSSIAAAQGGDDGSDHDRRSGRQSDRRVDSGHHESGHDDAGHDSRSGHHDSGHRGRSAAGANSGGRDDSNGSGRQDDSNGSGARDDSSGSSGSGGRDGSSGPGGGDDSSGSGSAQ